MRDRLRRRARRKWQQADGFDIPDVGAADDFGAVAAVVVALVIGVLLFFLWPFIIAAIEIVLLAVLLVVGLIGKVILRRPWIIEATNGVDQIHRWRVVGWRASGARRREIEEALAAGLPIAPDESVVIERDPRDAGAGPLTR